MILSIFCKKYFHHHKDLELRIQKIQTGPKYNQNEPKIKQKTKIAQILKQLVYPIGPLLWTIFFPKPIFFLLHAVDATTSSPVTIPRCLHAHLAWDTALPSHRPASCVADSQRRAQMGWNHQAIPISFFPKPSAIFYSSLLPINFAINRRMSEITGHLPPPHLPYHQSAQCRPLNSPSLLPVSPIAMNGKN